MMLRHSDDCEDESSTTTPSTSLLLLLLVGKKTRERSPSPPPPVSHPPLRALTDTQNNNKEEKQQQPWVVVGRLNRVNEGDGMKPLANINCLLFCIKYLMVTCLTVNVCRMHRSRFRYSTVRWEGVGGYLAFPFRRRRQTVVPVVVGEPGLQTRLDGILRT